jgi:hypothetical protein
MTIYCYHPETGEFLRAETARVVRGDVIVPKHATTEPPPEAGEHECARFVSGEWEVVPDYRTTEAWRKADGSRHTFALGVEPDEDVTFEKPERGQVWNNELGGWVTPETPYDKARRAAILAEWPVHAQLEAITENAMGRPEKLDALKAFILSVKGRFPKPRGDV